MKFELEHWNRGITNDELLADLRRVAGVLAKDTVTYDEYPRVGRCASSIFEQRFGSWNSALEAAGLVISSRRNIPQHELFENLEAVWRALGRQPKKTDLQKPLSRFGPKPYENRFGSWRKALEAFVVFVEADDVQEEGESSEVASIAGPRFPGLGLRFRVLLRDAFRCQACGRSPAMEAGVELHVDHIIPWSKSGATTLANLRTLCERCNFGKGNLLEADV